MFWTFQPKKEQSERKHLPFITWPVQDECIDWLIDGIRNGGDRLVDKSREMGATWIILGCFMVEWLFVPDTTLLVVSRKEEYVWKRGNPDTLYWKLLYLHRNLPIWAQPPLRKGVELTERHMLNPWNNSVIDGESTNADVGAGGRRQAIMLDEFSRVDANQAESIAEAISDTTPCRIFNSTPTSRGHPFGKIRFSNQVPVFTLPWYRHPWKNRGLYRSPDLNSVDIRDIAYYRAICPEVFNSVEQGVPVRHSDLMRELLNRVGDNVERRFSISFKADGSARWRSPWYDREEARRTPRDLATNIDINYAGSGDVVFSQDTLRRMIEEKVAEPKYKGEVTYAMHENVIDNVEFSTVSGRRDLWWWPELRGSRPDQTHNYIIGCDISLGTGASNSACTIFDCDTDTKVGAFVTPRMHPALFAEAVYAIAIWVGGVTKMPFLIFEANGVGQIFDKRMFQLGYDFVYRTREEKLISRKHKATRGWYSSGDNKLNLCVAYDAALSATFHPNLQAKKFINLDARSLREAEDYVFYKNTGLGPSQCEADEGGARAAHGDMVIADALCNLARFDQPRAKLRHDTTIGAVEGTFAYRRRQREIKAQENKEVSKWLI